MENGTGFRHQLEFQYRDFKQPIRIVYFVSFGAKRNNVPLVHDYFGVSKFLHLFEVNIFHTKVIIRFSGRFGSFTFAEVLALCIGAKANVPNVRLDKIEF